MNWELWDIQAGFRKGKGREIKLPTPVGSLKKVREFQKNIYFCFTDFSKAFHCVDHSKLWKMFKEMGIAGHLPASWEICLHVKKQHLEPDMQQWTGSKLGKEYIKAVYCHLAYLTYMQSTSC